MLIKNILISVATAVTLITSLPSIANTTSYTVIETEDAIITQYHDIKVQHDSNYEIKPSIVGGTEAYEGMNPWQARIELNGNTICGGTLINDLWVVTAAHCLTDNANRYTVILGDLDTDDISRHEQEFDVAEKIVHAKYDDDTNENDIALLRLSTPVTFNYFIDPLPLASEDFYWASNLEVVATGWGDVSHGGSVSKKLMEVNLTFISNSDCGSSAYSYGNDIKDGMLCAGTYDGGRDTCQGDSGGPLIVKDSEGGTYLFGVTSWGHGCGDASFPGVYTNVRDYSDWIEIFVEWFVEVPPRRGSGNEQ